MSSNKAPCQVINMASDDARVDSPMATDLLSPNGHHQMGYVFIRLPVFITGTQGRSRTCNTHEAVNIKSSCYYPKENKIIYAIFDFQNNKNPLIPIKERGFLLISEKNYISSLPHNSISVGTLFKVIK